MSIYIYTGPQNNELMQTVNEVASALVRDSWKIAFVRENIGAPSAVVRDYLKIASMQDDTEAASVV